MGDMDFAGSNVFFFSGLGHGSARVLVVCGEPDSRLRLTQLLEDDSHTIEQAATIGGDIPFACGRWSPDVVLMDVATLDVSGLQALVHMKVDELTSSIPVILMSVFADADLEPEFAAMGADGCLDNMAHDDVIREAVEMVLA